MVPWYQWIKLKSVCTQNQKYPFWSICVKIAGSELSNKNSLHPCLWYVTNFFKKFWGIPATLANEEKNIFYRSDWISDFANSLGNTMRSDILYTTLLKIMAPWYSHQGYSVKIKYWYSYIFHHKYWFDNSEITKFPALLIANKQFALFLEWWK